MKANYEQFIGMYSDVFPEYWCNHVIDWYENVSSKNNSIISNRQQYENVEKYKKNDEFLFLNLKNHDFGTFNGESAINIFWRELQQCFNHYVDEYDVLKSVKITCTNAKIQKTIPGGGYHLWHYEQGNNGDGNRCLAYMIYLNSIEEAGETEFLYQQLRIPPKENCCLIWPAGHTHAHRGNVVHGNKAKYVITGWFHNE